MKIVHKLCHATILTTALCGSAYASHYIIETLPIPLNSFISNTEQQYALTENGDVIWFGGGQNSHVSTIESTPGQVYLYKSGTTSALTANSRYKSLLRINKKGQAAWVESNTATGADSQIIAFYNGSEVINILPSGKVNTLLSLSDNGTLFWQGSNDELNFRLFSHDSRGIHELGPAPLEYEINNQGQIAWIGTVIDENQASTRKLFFFNGNSVQQVTNHSGFGWDIALNNQGDMMWVQYGLIDSTSTLLATIQNAIINVSSNPDVHFQYDINDQGLAFWKETSKFTEKNTHLFAFDGQNLHQLAANASAIPHVQLSNNGKLAYAVQNDRLTELNYFDGQQLKTLLKGELQITSLKAFDDGSLYIAYRDVNGMTAGRYDGNQFYPIPNTAASSTAMGSNFSNNGQLAWVTSSPEQPQVNLNIFDGKGSEQLTLTESSFTYHFPQINDQGHVILPVINANDDSMSATLYLIQPVKSQ